jgi:hypothetical protein
MKTLTLILSGGGLAAVVAAFFGYRKAEETKKATEAAVAGGGEIKLRLTGYYPFTAKESEKKMEGAPVDRKGGALHTVEDFFSGKSDHVSLSGDDSAFPFGQLITFPWSDGRTVKGRVTDTGSHFRGSQKAYRAMGNEPIDVCVYSKDTHPPTFVTANIIKGDTLDKSGKEVAVSKFQGQDVKVGALDFLGSV